jgi:hypothetical protein
MRNWRLGESNQLSRASVRKSSIFFISMAAAATLLCLAFVHAAVTARDGANGIEDKKGLVRVLQLTDICLFTEARYTRHLSQADLHTAFQDHPMALEHFPSGSLVPPPPGLRRAP